MAVIDHQVENKCCRVERLYAILMEVKMMFIYALILNVILTCFGGLGSDSTVFNY